MKMLTFIATTVISIAISGGFTACEKVNNEAIYGKYVVFEHYAMYHAWGTSSIHWIVDNEGNVRTVRKNDYIVTGNINKNLSYFDSLIFKVDTNELKYYISLIQPASKGLIDSTERGRVDFGTTLFNCYLGDKAILISSLNDNMDYLNTDTNAIKIGQWLSNINTNIYSK